MNASATDFLRQLERDGVVETGTARLIPLTGGVSSDIYRVETGDRSFVVKRALAQLKVKADWQADLSRNHYERAYIDYVGHFEPDSVPQLLETRGNADSPYFCMEYLEGFATWKADLLGGRCDTALAARAGGVLATIHGTSWGDPGVAERFDALENFDQLRIDPYLRATAMCHPDLEEPILAEAQRLRASRYCLVHGDYSPKNLMHRDGRLVILDCEVACYADPAFDLAFLLNHLLLKGLYHAPERPPLEELFHTVLDAYGQSLPVRAGEVEARAAVLLPMLLLARVDGKSPVEYLEPEKQAVARDFARNAIRTPDTHPNLRELAQAWYKQL